MTFLQDFWRALLAGAIILALLWFGVHQLNQAREARGAAEHLRAENVALEAAKARSDSIAADSIATLVAAREASEAREDSLAAEAEEARQEATEAASRVDSVLVERADTVVVRLVEEERAAHEAEKNALRAENMELHAQVVLADQTIDVLRERIEESEELTRSLRQEADAWERAANPGLVGRIVGSLPSIGIGALIVVGALAL